LADAHGPYEYVPEDDKAYVKRNKTQLYCKEQDVAQLELLLKRYLEDLAESRRSRDRAKADLAIADARSRALRPS